MKFTDGQWKIQPGFSMHYARQLFEWEIEPQALSVVAVDHQNDRRARGLGADLLSVRYTAPLADVIRVQITHLAGERPRQPGFPLRLPEPPGVEMRDESDFLTLTSGRLAVRVAKGPAWQVDFLAEGRPLTGSGEKALAAARDAQGAEYVLEQLGLGVGELVYGLGERFSAFVKNGQAIEMWNRDGGTSTEQAYKNIPFYLTNRGYGVFVNHPGRVSFEAASERNTRIQFSAPGQTLEYFVIYGPTPKEVLQKYTALTGRPPLPPAWSFGLWLSTSFTTSYDEATVTEFVEGMAARHIPLHVFHFDCLWMKDGHWVDFTWDDQVFPDPQGMLRRLKAHGLHICTWINPYVGQRSSLFAEAHHKRYLLQKPDGDTWQSTSDWQPGMGMVDFTNPQAVHWYTAHLRRLLEMGVDCFKTDFGERIPTEVVYADGADPERMHNFYAYLYNQAVFNLLQEARGEGEAVVFARSAAAGSQQFPVHWGGDSFSTFESMAESLRGGLSFGLSGFGFWSHDIGGFEGSPAAAVYKRWVAFGLLSSHSRLHGSGSYRVPWLFDEEAVDVLRFFTQLKCRLMPYLFAQAVEAAQTGVPVLRAMLLEFPADPGCETLDRQYMLGERLLAAPVFSESSVTYYVPAGCWTNLLSGEVLTGPAWRTEEHGYLSLPLLVRPNTLLAVGANPSRPDYDYASGVTLQLYELADQQSASATVPDLHGQPALRARAARQGQRIQITVAGAAHPWQVLLANIRALQSVQGAAWEATAQGVLLTPRAGAVEISLELPQAAG